MSINGRQALAVVGAQKAAAIKATEARNDFLGQLLKSSVEYEKDACSSRSLVSACCKAPNDNNVLVIHREIFAEILRRVVQPYEIAIHHESSLFRMSGMAPRAPGETRKVEHVAVNNRKGMRFPS